MQNQQVLWVKTLRTPQNLVEERVCYARLPQLGVCRDCISQGTFHLDMDHGFA